MYKRNVAKNAVASARQLAINAAVRKMENIAARDAYRQIPFVLTAFFFSFCMLLLQILSSMCMSTMKTIAAVWWLGHSAHEARDSGSRHLGASRRLFSLWTIKLVALVFAFCALLLHLPTSTCAAEDEEGTTVLSGHLGTFMRLPWVWLIEAAVLVFQLRMPMVHLFARIYMAENKNTTNNEGGGNATGAHQGQSLLFTLFLTSSQR